MVKDERLSGVDFAVAMVSNKENYTSVHNRTRCDLVDRLRRAGLLAPRSTDNVTHRS
jgi:hypothetical protein